MYEVIFLWSLALIYLVFAIIQDIKTREIANWINFSLIIFALGFRFFYSLFNADGFSFFYQGVIGFGIFFIVGNLMYYGKVFAGGDAKLMIALGPVLPYFPDLISNTRILFDFLLIFLFVGFAYTIVTSIFLCFKNLKSFKKEFPRQLRENKKILFVGILIGIILLLLGFIDNLFFVLGILAFFTSYLYVYSKTIDEVCMVKRIKVKNLREGDWLYSDLKLGKKKLKAKWDGLSNSEIKSISKRYKEVKIRQGIPFSPVFLISFIISIILNLLGLRLWNSPW